jgi:CubicO group peptidase (beta-lactamase class C family)
VTPAQKARAAFVPGFFDARSWGFGMAVVTRRDDVRSVGTYGWDGGLGSSWYTDPRAELIAILMTQEAFTSPNPPAVLHDFFTAAYAAIDD